MSYPSGCTQDAFDRANDIEQDYDEEPEALHFKVEVDTETYPTRGTGCKWLVNITHPDGEEEYKTFPTEASAQMWIGERIIGMAGAMRRAARCR